MRSILELETGPANSNPVARWVEAVQPWMPGNNESEDAQETPDWTSRAKGEKMIPILWSSCAVLTQMGLSSGVFISHIGFCETGSPEIEPR